jgi:hypothetical protein
MRFVVFFIIAAAAFSSLAWFRSGRSTEKKAPANNGYSAAADAVKVSERLQPFAVELKQYAVQHKYNSHYCFLVDMKIPCGSNRFFVYDLKKDAVLQSGLVTHGYGNSSYSRVVFSNVPGSNSSSLGTYKIGMAYQGRFGLAYKLHGLDSTNSNAYKRFVVLHAHGCVPDTTVAPGVICMSQGCPTVAPAFLRVLKSYLDNADKPILLKIIY